MLVIDSPCALREAIKQFKQQGKAISFIPTMGNLHSGHIELVKRGQQIAPVSVVSIFVNPMQFNNADDLKNYPKTLTADCQALEAVGVDIVFTPSSEVIYPNGLAAQTYIEVPELSNCLEGELRPGHFRGMSTIVNKLFNLVQPDYACFGEKDFQQLAIVKQMVADMALPIEIIPVATVREESGLAMSSRNNKLSEPEKQLAPLLAKVMNQLAKDVQKATTQHSLLIHDASRTLNASGFAVDDIHIVDSATLKPVTETTKQAVILMAAFLGTTRLIDNKVVTLNEHLHH
ncbi:pantoate--beta-alanine ligase [Psychromonas sp. psych-6C06]|uniref:pantoate--beta-alanine ligase n=1 Tax=Psychromonas sp. psych-6C06 TaxID=2058089 RepID=UPI000C331260|nr:pantoate--beta-alanine ligase [Psychromonas sp. psych-6C06]PKF61292.1 pantoate--beta-alanine ligase [Psychromonas sp. psych-6C06]